MTHSSNDLTRPELIFRFKEAVKQVRVAKYPEEKKFWRKELDNITFTAVFKHNITEPELKEFID